MEANQIKEALSAPFAASDVEWRVQNVTQDKTRGMAVPYIDSRAIQNRLDATVGPYNWKTEFKPWHQVQKKDKDDKTAEKVMVGSQLCGLSVYSEERKEWITKWDGAERHFIDAAGNKAIVVIRRLCCKGCGKIHHELPDMLVPYKQHIDETFEKVYEHELWSVCCDDNTIRRLRYWLVHIFLPMAARLFSPLPHTGRALLLQKISNASPGWLRRLTYTLINGNRWHTRFAVSSA